MKSVPLVYMPSREIIGFFESFDPHKISLPAAPVVNCELDLAAAQCILGQVSTADLLHVLLIKLDPISIKNVLEVHRAVLNVKKTSWRKVSLNVGVNQADSFGFTSPIFDVKNEFSWLISRALSIKHDSIFIAFFLFYFLHLHPFVDGNGRMSRILIIHFLSERRGAQDGLGRFVAIFTYLRKDILARWLWEARVNSVENFIKFFSKVLFEYGEYFGKSCDSRVGVREYVMSIKPDGIFGR
uniref:Fic family protein n=1 Tax=Xanthomonas sp. 0924 TaxID=2835534 RepID=UPI003F807272